MNNIHQRIETIKQQIQQVQSTTQQVTLLAVSKTQSASRIREAFAAGQTQFGENYLQECLQKQIELSDLDIEWHFIGPIQSNKTQQIAQHFDWVHSIDRLKIAQRLNNARYNQAKPLNTCIQVNISNETTKSGILIEQLEGLAAAFSSLSNLKLRGLMAIPAPTPDTDLQRQQFSEVKQCFDALNAKGYGLDTLSMGMSNDYVTAIEEGATIVRIGSNIFGPRT